MGKAEILRNRRLDRMRMGQSACDFVTLISDPEQRVAIVPLTEAEYMQALESVAATDAPNSMAGLALLDRQQANEIVVRTIREDDDLTKRVFNSTDEMFEVLTVSDVDAILDGYNEMVEKSSPQLDQIPPEELEAVKKVLQEMDWSALSGRSWYALRRFLSTITPMLQQANSPGFGSMDSSTTTSE